MQLLRDFPFLSGETALGLDAGSGRTALYTHQMPLNDPLQNDTLMDVSLK